jgi:DNA end-binding protein Ku
MGMSIRGCFHDKNMDLPDGEAQIWQLSAGARVSRTRALAPSGSGEHTMSARAIGSATVSFGLVTVPVKLYSAGDSTAAISFNWIHRDCGSRLKQQYVCAREGTVVEREDMVKGYEFGRDQYVLFTPDELKALEQKADNTVEIVEFVPADRVQRVYLDKPIYLGPDKGGDRAYRLLSAAMRETGLSGLGRYAARGKQYLVLLTPFEDGILMEQLRYSHEIRSFSEVPLGDAEVKERELELAVQLIRQVASDEFRPDEYRDEVRERILELIQRKIEGEDITEAPAPEAKPQVIDLMAALKASLARTEAARSGATGGAASSTGVAASGSGAAGADAASRSRSKSRRPATGSGSARTRGSAAAEAAEASGPVAEGTPRKAAKAARAAKTARPAQQAEADEAAGGGRRSPRRKASGE